MYAWGTRRAAGGDALGRSWAARCLNCGQRLIRCMLASVALAACHGNENIAPASPAKLAFTVSPGATVAGVTITPPVQVEIQDAGGNVVTNFASAVTISLGSNPSGAALS